MSLVRIYIYSIYNLAKYLKRELIKKDKYTRLQLQSIKSVSLSFTSD